VHTSLAWLGQRQRQCVKGLVPVHFADLCGVDAFFVAPGSLEMVPAQSLLEVKSVPCIIHPGISHVRFSSLYSCNS
jgi:hypothetical protein